MAPISRIYGVREPVSEDQLLTATPNLELLTKDFCLQPGLASRLSFPATDPPDPRRVSEGSLKGSLKGLRKKGSAEDPSKTLRKPFENPSDTPSETPSETLLKPFWGLGDL